MAFAEDLDAFLDVDNGFAVVATLDGDAVRVIFDAPGAEALGGEVVTTEPSALVPASAGAAVGQALVLDAGDLPVQLIQHAGTYSVRSVMPEGPDGAFVRAFLARGA
jgi:O-acetyl-ADP-ribose deacetylase (regulator of RNase III)